VAKQKEHHWLSKDTYFTPSLWKGMRLQVSEGSMLERSASGTSKDLASVPSNLAEKAWTIALGRGSTSTAAIPLTRSTGCGTQHGQTRWQMYKERNQLNRANAVTHKVSCNRSVQSSTFLCSCLPRNNTNNTMTVNKNCEMQIQHDKTLSRRQTNYIDCLISPLP